jgi:hypothetical protein
LPSSDQPTTNTGTSRYAGTWAAITILLGPAGLLYAVTLLRNAPDDQPQTAATMATAIGLAIVIYSMWQLAIKGQYWVMQAYLWIGAMMGMLALSLAFTSWFVHLRELPWGVIAPTMAVFIAGAIVSKRFWMLLLLAIPAAFIGSMMASGL